MIKAIIIDDEKDCRAALSHDIAKYCKDVDLVGEASGVTAGLELIYNKMPDLIFLDVQMGDGTGFDLLDKFYHGNKPATLNTNSLKVIFTTAYDKFAVNAIKFSALDYLLKPVDPEELISAVEKYRQRASQLQLNESVKVLLENKKSSENKFHRIALNTGDAIEIFNTADIIRCESESNYTKFFIKNKKPLMISRTLKEYDDMLSAEGFYRIHNSHLINLSCITKYVKSDGGYVIMEDGSNVPISRSKKDEFVALIS